MNSAKWMQAEKGFFAEVLRFYALDGTVEPYRGVYRVDGAVPKILKPLKTGAIQAFLIGKLLGRTEGSMIPKLVRTADGRDYLWFRGNRILMTEQVPGIPADYRNDWDLDAAISAMGRWHQLSRECIDRGAVPWDAIRFDTCNVWKKRLQEFDDCREMALRSQDAFSRIYLQKWREYTRQAYETFQDFSNIASSALQTPPVLCYHDWAFHNVLVDGPNAFLIDFDYMILDTAVHDRANLIGRYLRLFQWNEKALLKILWKFDRHYPWRRGEIRLLRIFLSFPYDYWMIGRQYFIEKQPWSGKYFWDQWQRKVARQENRNRALLLLEQLESGG